MQRSTPTDRLICDNVGFGKTEVALSASFKTVLNNRQLVLLVPTTILKNVMPLHRLLKTFVQMRVTPFY